MIITIARKPLEGTVAENVVLHACGGLNIDACRIASNGDHFTKGISIRKMPMSGDARSGKSLGMFAPGAVFIPTNHEAGRWPANTILVSNPQILLGFPDTVSGTRNGSRKEHSEFGTFSENAHDSGYFRLGNSGSAARFFKLVVVGDSQE